MEYNPEDIDVIHLLKKLKEANGAYPQEMLALRRQRYLSQVAEISGAVGIAVALKNAARGGKSMGLPPAAGTVIEALLVVALVAEAGAVTYFYRDKLAQAIRSFVNKPKVEEAASPPVIPSPFLEELNPSPVVTETGFTASPAVTITVTLTAAGTPSPELAAEAAQENEAGSPSIQPASTQPANGNNGNHYGQTPKPARIKEMGNNPANNQDTQDNKDNKDNDSKKKP